MPSLSNHTSTGEFRLENVLTSRAAFTTSHENISDSINRGSSIPNRGLAISNCSLSERLSIACYRDVGLSAGSEYSSSP